MNRCRSIVIRRPVVMVILLAASVLIPAPATATPITSASPEAHAVSAIYHCATSPSCDTTNANKNFVNYSAVCSSADCNFVSAANWESIVLGLEPSAKTLKSEYASAGQTFGGGTNMSQLWTWWRAHGIDGAVATKIVPRGRGRASTESAVSSFGALIVNDVITKKNSYIGMFRMGIGVAIMVVDGFDPKGPIVVYQAQTIQMTWVQWAVQVRGMWEITTSKPPVAVVTTTTTTHTPIATTPSTPQSVTVTFNANGGSGSMPNETESAGTTTALSYNWFTLTGYSFTGWNTSPSGNGTSYTDGAAFLFAVDTTLYAQWIVPPWGSSNNWSGYVLPSNNSIFTSVSAQWVVPTLNCVDTPNAKSTPWVGIGGFLWPTGGTSGQLLQIGTEDDCVNGVQQDSAWWELWPLNAQQSFYNFPVLPGNLIQASVFQQTTGAWETLLTNATTGLSAVMVTGDGWGVSSNPSSGPTSYQGTTLGLTYAGGRTAEWIVEDTGMFTGGNFPFANYGSVTFSNTSSAPSLPITSSDWLEMAQSKGVLSLPGPINNGGFTLTYVGP